ncbi:hemagglutinin repeat-containing protein [Neisseriaceae bacterium TC5R-5]|nr:hemagglutinin repeat-containing protein [Neisseriaceae bacterium TC5R-5]
MNAYVKADPATAGGLNLNISLGQSRSSSNSQSSRDQSASSQLNAGRNLTLNATGGDLTVQGSQLNAGHNASLSASGDINLLASQNQTASSGSNQSSGWAAGVNLGITSQGIGASAVASAHQGKGNNSGQSQSWMQSSVNAGNQLTLQSGGDTTIKGATASGQQVTADIGGNLNIESTQDSDHYQSRQNSQGISVGIPISGNGGSLSANVGRTRLDSDYNSVQNQSGIKAGDSGFDITVQGNTDLKGAVIASSDKAVQDGNNQLTTGSLTSSDLHNEARYSGDSLQLGGGYSTNGSLGKDQQGNTKADGSQTPGSTQPNQNGFSASGPLYAGASDKASSTTPSGISGGQITITNEAKQQELTGKTAEQTIADLNRDVSSDKDTSNALKPIFDKDKIEAGFDIVNALQRESGTFLDNRAKESAAAQKALDEELAKPIDQRNQARIHAAQQTLDDNATWEMGGTGRQILTAINGAAGGNVSASTAQFVQSAAVNYLQALAAEQVKQLADNLNSESARTALHALLACAGAAAQNSDCGSAASGAAASVILNNLLSQNDDELTAEQKQARSNLINSIITGAVALAGGDAGAAGNAGRIESDNNSLSKPAGVTWVDQLKGLSATQEKQLIQKYKDDSKKLSRQVQSCSSMSSCGGLAEELKENREFFMAMANAFSKTDPERAKLYLQEAKASQADMVIALNRQSDLGGYGLTWNTGEYSMRNTQQDNHSISFSYGFHLPVVPGIAVGPNVMHDSKSGSSTKPDMVFGSIADIGASIAVNGDPKYSTPTSINYGAGKYLGLQVTISNQKAWDEKSWLDISRYINSFGLGLGFGLSLPGTISTDPTPIWKGESK